MIKIFRLEPDNIHYPVLWGNPSDFAKVTDLNFKSIKGNWKTFHFEFYKKNKPEGREPDIACLTPGFAFRADLKERLFDQDGADIELLPIVVDGQDWLFVIA